MHKRDARCVRRVVKRMPIRVIVFCAVAVNSQHLEFAKTACLRMSSTKPTLYVAGLSSAMQGLSVYTPTAVVMQTQGSRNVPDAPPGL
eukprot:COSAG02_NODE_55260_length_291_cov_1.078125_1_plen_88_part_01